VALQRRNDEMTSFIKAAAERYPPGFRGEMTTTGREPAAQQAAGPPRWKVAALTWFGVFPVVTAMLTLAGPWLDRLPLVARTFAITAVLVPAMVFVVMPALTRAFRSWLQR
jgi:antibiotic biosynthesis monooxygenase (ABM) superfamily enzyme